MPAELRKQIQRALRQPQLSPRRGTACRLPDRVRLAGARRGDRAGAEPRRHCSRLAGGADLLRRAGPSQRHARSGVGQHPGQHGRAARGRCGGNPFRLPHQHGGAADRRAGAGPQARPRRAGGTGGPARRDDARCFLSPRETGGRRLAPPACRQRAGAACPSRLLPPEADAAGRAAAACGHGLRQRRQSDVCCGMGGSCSPKMPKVPAAMLARKLGRMAEPEAAGVAVDCPACLMQIRGGCAAAGCPVQVCHTAGWLAAAVGGQH